MEQAIITISESGRVNIPSGNVWMSEMELVELFGVIALTLQASIRAIYKSGTLCTVTTKRCDLAIPKSWATYYNLEVVIALAFRLNTYEASRIRQKVLEEILQRKESEIDFLILLGNNSHLYYNQTLMHPLNDLVVYGYLIHITHCTKR